MNNGYLQRIIKWRDKAKHDGTWGSTNVSGMYPFEVIDQLIKQLFEAEDKIIRLMRVEQMDKQIVEQARKEVAREIIYLLKTCAIFESYEHEDKVIMWIVEKFKLEG